MRRSALIVGCLGAILLVLTAYADSLTNSFHFDDSHVIENNLFIRSLENVALFFTDAHTFSSLPQNATYRPLVSLTLALDYRMAGGLHPRAFHLTQIVLLLALGAMLVPFYTEILDRGSRDPANPFIALFAATLFSVHAANSETMNLISARSEILASLGIVGSFLVYAHGERLRRWHLYLLPVLAGALAKATALIFPALLTAYVSLLDRQTKRRSGALQRTWPDWIVCMAGLLLLSKMNAPEWSSGSQDRWAYARTQPFIWLRYVQMFLVPAGLNADTDLRSLGFTDMRFWAGILFVTLLFWLMRYLASLPARRPIAFGVMWFTLALLPASSFFPLAELTNDHRMFMPFIGLTLAVVSGAAVLIRRIENTRGRRAVCAALAVCILAGQAAATWQRNKVWRSEETLWADVVRTSPHNGRGLMNYGNTLMAKGDYVGARNYYRRASAYTPQYSLLEINQGIVDGRLGDRAGAEAHFRRALALRSDADSHFFYGRWLVEDGRAPQAIPYLQQAVLLSPAFSNARDLLIQLQVAAGRGAEVTALASETARINPGDAVAVAIAHGRQPFADLTYEQTFKLGLSEVRARRFVDAALHFRAAIGARPSSADAWNNLGWCLANLGFYSEGISAFEQALAINPGFALARNNLRWARGVATAR